MRLTHYLASFLAFGSIGLVFGCSTAQPEDETNSDALNGTAQIFECRAGAVTGYSPEPCQAPFLPTGNSLYGVQEVIAGVSAMTYLCLRNAAPPPLFGKTFVSLDGNACEGQGILVRPIKPKLDRAMCGARPYTRYVSPSNGDSLLSPNPIPGWIQNGLVGYFFERPVTDQQCCLSDKACSGGAVCRTPGGACEAGCRRDSQCSGGQFCDQASFSCVAGTCRNDGECGQAQICEGFACRGGCRGDYACAEGHRCNGSTKTCE